jgi:uroporphyrinogen III methyltransferase/synthase
LKMSDQGALYLVGTGPGDPGLITVKGLALLREADVIVGDTLTHAKLLQEAPPEAEVHDVGGLHRGNKTSQREVTQLLLGLARQGKRVVRLWLGDPFVFGRAAEEMVEALNAGIRTEIVPGVTSAIAAPAYAGVPVIHKDYGTSFAVVTGFEPKELQNRPNWAALAGVETLVILMPLEKLPGIVDRLLAVGRTPGTPALAIQSGTLPQQLQVSTTLDTLVEAVERHQLEDPVIVVVGEVVKLAGELNWFRVGDEYPLLGQRVLVTRPSHQAADFMVALRALGAAPISFPTIEICPAVDTDPLDAAIQHLATGRRGTSSEQRYYDWLVLTSANGVTAFWERLQQAGLDSRCLATVKIAAIGPATAAALSQRSISPDLVPGIYTAEGVLEAFDRAGPVFGQRFLLARADIARKTLAEGLIKRGAFVDEITAYRTVPIQNGPPPPSADIVTFTSSSTVRGYVNCLGDRSPAEALHNSRVVCIGPITAATAKEFGVPVAAVAEEYTIDGLLDILREAHS